jgi:hypothetical protein
MLAPEHEKLCGYLPPIMFGVIILLSIYLAIRALYRNALGIACKIRTGFNISGKQLLTPSLIYQKIHVTKKGYLYYEFYECSKKEKALRFRFTQSSS